MTNVYFIRHAEAEQNVDSVIRPLTPKGRRDRERATDFLMHRNIDYIFSSHYTRCIQTLQDFAFTNNKPIKEVEDFCECKRNVPTHYPDDYYKEIMNNMWNNFNFKHDDYEECLNDVQNRSTIALEKLLAKHTENNIAIGSHITTMTVIINKYDPSYVFKDFWSVLTEMPWAVKMSFEGLSCYNIEEINLYSLRCFQRKQVK